MQPTKLHLVKFITTLLALLNSLLCLAQFGPDGPAGVGDYFYSQDPFWYQATTYDGSSIWRHKTYTLQSTSDAGKNCTIQGSSVKSVDPNNISIVQTTTSTRIDLPQTLFSNPAPTDFADLTKGFVITISSKLFVASPFNFGSDKNIFGFRISPTRELQVKMFVNGSGEPQFTVRDIVNGVVSSSQSIFWISSVGNGYFTLSFHVVLKNDLGTDKIIITPFLNGIPTTNPLKFSSGAVSFSNLYLGSTKNTSNVLNNDGFVADIYEFFIHKAKSTYSNGFQAQEKLIHENLNELYFSQYTAAGKAKFTNGNPNNSITDIGGIINLTSNPNYNKHTYSQASYLGIGSDFLANTGTDKITLNKRKFSTPFPPTPALPSILTGTDTNDEWQLFYSSNTAGKQFDYNIIIEWGRYKPIYNNSVALAPVFCISDVSNFASYKIITPVANDNDTYKYDNRKDALPAGITSGSRYLKVLNLKPVNTATSSYTSNVSFFQQEAGLLATPRIATSSGLSIAYNADRPNQFGYLVNNGGSGINYVYNRNYAFSGKKYAVMSTALNTDLTFSISESDLIAFTPLKNLSPQRYALLVDNDDDFTSGSKVYVLNQASVGAPFTAVIPSGGTGKFFTTLAVLNVSNCDNSSTGNEMDYAAVLGSASLNFNNLEANSRVLKVSNTSAFPVNEFMTLTGKGSSFYTKDLTYENANNVAGNNMRNMLKVDYEWCTRLTSGITQALVKPSIPNSYFSSIRPADVTYTIPALFVARSTTNTSAPANFNNAEVHALKYDYATDSYYLDVLTLKNYDKISIGLIHRNYYYSDGFVAAYGMGKAFENYEEPYTSDANYILSLSNPSSLDVNDYLVLSLKNSTINPNYVPTGYTNNITHMTRNIWRVNEYNEVGTVDVALDNVFFQYDADYLTKDYVLIISTDPTFTDQSKIRYVGLMKDKYGYYNAFKVNFNNGDYLRIGKGDYTYTYRQNLSNLFADRIGNGLSDAAQKVKNIFLEPLTNFQYSLPCTQGVQSAKLQLDFNAGEIFDFYSTSSTFNSTIKLKIKGFSTFPNATTQNQLFEVNNLVELKIDQKAPRQLYTMDLSSYMGSLKRVEVTIDSYTAPLLSEVSKVVKLDAKVELTPLVEVNTYFELIEQNLVSYSNNNTKANFSWKVPTSDVNFCQAPKFEFQLLRLFNNDPLKVSTPTNIRASVDWTKALTLITDKPSISLTMTEGTGYYLWRVRPIGNLFPGGENNPKNWGVWNDYWDGYDEINSSWFNPADNHFIFYYTQFEEAKNFSYNRVFSEGNKIKEAITYANGLNQVKQVQTVLPSQANVLGEEMIKMPYGSVFGASGNIYSITDEYNNKLKGASTSTKLKVTANVYLEKGSATPIISFNVSSKNSAQLSFLDSDISYSQSISALGLKEFEWTPISFDIALQYSGASSSIGFMIEVTNNAAAGKVIIKNLSVREYLDAYPIVTSQSIPDFSGRNSISFLPAPITSSSYASQGIVYRTNLIKNESNMTYSPFDFDLFSDDQNEANDTYRTPKKVKGVLNDYYSDANQDLCIASTGGDANGGYPFTRVLYNNDGTGDVLEQSGIGADLKMNPESTKDLAKTTRIIYTTATDDELILLFGKDAPRADKVEKTITIDPHGVGSVTYTDALGKTIATAMLPSDDTKIKNLDKLSDEETSFKDRTVYKVLNNQVVGDKIVSTAEVIITTATVGAPVILNFEQTYKVPYIQSAVCTTACASCKYKSSVTITKKGTACTTNSTKNISLPTDLTNTGYGQPVLNANCPSSVLGPKNTATYSITEPGVYVISKTIEKDLTGESTYVSGIIDPIKTKFNTTISTLTTVPNDPILYNTESKKLKWVLEQLILAAKSPSTYNFLSAGFYNVDPKFDQTYISNGVNVNDVNFSIYKLTNDMFFYASTSCCEVSFRLKVPDWLVCDKYTTRNAQNLPIQSAMISVANELILKVNTLYSETTNPNVYKYIDIVSRDEGNPSKPIEYSYEPNANPSVLRNLLVNIVMDNVKTCEEMEDCLRSAMYMYTPRSTPSPFDSETLPTGAKPRIVDYTGALKNYPNINDATKNGAKDALGNTSALGTEIGMIGNFLNCIGTTYKGFTTCETNFKERAYNLILHRKNQSITPNSSGSDSKAPNSYFTACEAAFCGRSISLGGDGNVVTSEPYYDVCGKLTVPTCFMRILKPTQSVSNLILSTSCTDYYTLESETGKSGSVINWTSFTDLMYANLKACNSAISNPILNGSKALTTPIDVKQTAEDAVAGTKNRCIKKCSSETTFKSLVDGISTQYAGGYLETDGTVTTLDYPAKCCMAQEIVNQCIATCNSLTVITNQCTKPDGTPYQTYTYGPNATTLKEVLDIINGKPDVKNHTATDLSKYKLTVKKTITNAVKCATPDKYHFEWEISDNDNNFQLLDANGTNLLNYGTIKEITTSSSIVYKNYVRYGYVNKYSGSYVVQYNDPNADNVVYGSSINQESVILYSGLRPSGNPCTNEERNAMISADLEKDIHIKTNGSEFYYGNNNGNDIGIKVLKDLQNKTWILSKSSSNPVNETLNYCKSGYNAFKRNSARINTGTTPDTWLFSLKSDNSIDKEFSFGFEMLDFLVEGNIIYGIVKGDGKVYNSTQLTNNAYYISETNINTGVTTFSIPWTTYYTGRKPSILKVGSYVWWRLENTIYPYKALSSCPNINTSMGYGAGVTETSSNNFFGTSGVKRSIYTNGMESNFIETCNYYNPITKEFVFAGKYFNSLTSKNEVYVGVVILDPVMYNCDLVTTYTNTKYFSYSFASNGNDTPISVTSDATGYYIGLESDGKGGDRVGSVPDNTTTIPKGWLVKIAPDLTCNARKTAYRFYVPTVSDPWWTSVVTVVPEREKKAKFNREAVVDNFNQEVYTCTERLKEKLQQEYRETCGSFTGFDDITKYDYKQKQVHYTLYYYDRAGNLIKTVTPLDVQRREDANKLPLNRTNPVDYKMASTYKYNTLGQVVEQNTPDGGKTTFLYNRLGMLRFSQNAKQAKNNTFSYTKYDELGRVIEVGQSSLSYNNMVYADLNSKLQDAAGNVQLGTTSFPVAGNTELSVTFYSQPTQVRYLGKEQRNLQNRISFTLKDEDGNLTTKTDQVGTYFSYDAHGNVEWLVQDIPGLGRNYIEYQYDLISNKVTQVVYNKEMPDEFWHRYCYDEDNRIIKVETSTSGVLWETDASYNYYGHGPMRRTLLGNDKIQGLDYTYTAQGWLKAINHPAIPQGYDPGQDGQGGSRNALDEFGMVLNYYDNDFKRTYGTGASFKESPLNKTFATGSTMLNTNLPAAADNQLYNGNISTWTVSYGRVDDAATTSDNLNGNQAVSIAFRYRYDVLNRLKKADMMLFNNASKNYTASVFGSSEQAYDANGNIMTMKRPADASTFYDNMTYSHKYQSSTAENNQLLSVADGGTVTNSATFPAGTTTYEYDEIGNLKKDGNTQIEWNAYGKPSKVTTSTDIINFSYDAMGNRVKKSVYKISTLKTTTQHYVRDASGNIMAIYKKDENGVVSLEEQPIYGSDRVGIYHPQNNVRGVPVAGAGSDQNQVTIYPGNDYTLSSGQVGILPVNFDINTPGVFYDGTVTLDGGTLIVEGKYQVNGVFNPPGIQIKKGTIVIMPTGILEINVYNTLNLASGSKLINYGTLRIFGDLIVDNDAEFHNNGIEFNTLGSIFNGNTSNTLKGDINSCKVMDLMGQDTEYGQYFDAMYIGCDETIDKVAPVASKFTRNLLTRSYEVKDHLGNVRLTVADSKTRERVLTQTTAYGVENATGANVETAIVKEGLKSLKLLSNGASVNATPVSLSVSNLNLKAGDKLDFKAFLYLPGLVPTGKTMSIQIVEFNGTTYTNRSQINFTSATPADNLPLNAWKEYTLASYTIPAGVTNTWMYYLQISGNAAAPYTMYVDLATLTITRAASSPAPVQYYAVTENYTDYYAFGSTMPKRSKVTSSLTEYRYGFNGMEKINEWNGDYDFGARIYDSRIGKWFSIDPLAAKYPFLSPYVFVADNPILYIDQDGRENIIYIVVARKKNGDAEIGINQANDIVAKANKTLKEVLKINTRVVLLEEGTIIEKTDNVVAIGNNRENIQKTLSKYAPAFAGSKHVAEWVKGGSDNPETGNNNITPDRMGAVVDVDDFSNGLLGNTLSYSEKAKKEAEQNVSKTDMNDLAGMAIIHASGHTAKLNHNSIELSIMNDGRDIQNAVQNSGQMALNSKKKLGDKEKDAFDSRFTSNKASTLKAVGKRPSRTKVD